MQTNFTAEQLADPEIARSDAILRKCVHCGFCIATCPTYQLNGNELDSPRGRIYLIKSLLENGGGASAKVVDHIDQCLSCLSCMTTCPADVDYMHLVDVARRRIEEDFTRPMGERLLRALLGTVLTRPALFRACLSLAALARPVARFLPRRFRPLFDRTVPLRVRRASRSSGEIFRAEGRRRKRVTLLTGCVQQTLGPQINEATIRLLTRLGCEVVTPAGAGCCGGISRQLGDRRGELRRVKRNIRAWLQIDDSEGLDAVVINTSGCGTVVKDYGHVLEDDPEWAGRAARISSLTVDVAELVAELGFEPTRTVPGLAVAYHAACSLQHGQRVTDQPIRLLRDAGFAAHPVGEEHLCCGSAGVYSLLRPKISRRLRDRKVANILTLKPDIIATGNIGCLLQIASATKIPLVHTVELLDWASGGAMPRGLETIVPTIS